jgi:hypothetical protein
MNGHLVRYGRHIFNMDGVANVKWKDGTLYIDFIGGRFHAFHGLEAEAVWRAMVVASVDLETGEVGSECQ